MPSTGEMLKERFHVGELWFITTRLEDADMLIQERNRKRSNLSSLAQLTAVVKRLQSLM